ncbi:imc subcompartment protein isp4 [Cystoisospora suis]|uniref:Imc subcompartment protein isp4 n=1 Tax=Cystoisospora suis TaxID=483139 RepID=A0A2C6L578_9APIC|nr:imc subcompartment protein isp4 [Cystoisospora suis]
MDRHGNSIRCVVKLNKMRTALLLLSGDKGRTVPLQEIRSIFYGDELKRLDAFEADNTACVAVYLVSGSALPIVFPSEDQKFQFLDGVESLQFAFTSQGTAPAGESAAKSYAAR